MFDYDYWKTTDINEDYDRPGCPCCDNLESKLAKSAVHFKEALEILYSGRALNHMDRLRLEEHLDEVTYFFDLKLKKGDILKVYQV
jgi:hypothetical protein